MGPIMLRNRIVQALTNWDQLGCRVVRGDRFFRLKTDRQGLGLHLLVFGTSKDGEAILIYPYPHKGRVPLDVCRLMRDFFYRGALVGCAAEIGDAWDIVQNNPDEFKRKKRTYRFMYELAIWKKRRTENGE
jgi:hypothetical protein